MSSRMSSAVSVDKDSSSTLSYSLRLCRKTTKLSSSSISCTSQIPPGHQILLQVSSEGLEGLECRGLPRKQMGCYHCKVPVHDWVTEGDRNHKYNAFKDHLILFMLDAIEDCFSGIIGQSFCHVCIMLFQCLKTRIFQTRAVFLH